MTKLSEKYTNQANDLMRKSEEADSLTNWTMVKELQEKARIATLEENKEAKEKELHYRQRIINLVGEVNKTHNMDLSFGYIGNDDRKGNDDRGFYVSAPHPGRAGKTSDRIGDYKADQLKKLLAVCEEKLVDWANDHRKTHNY